MYYLLGICLSLAAFFALNALGALATTAFWMGADPRTSRWSATVRANLLFALRVLPVAGALAFVLIFLIPAYLIHEPYPAPEAVGVYLFVLALVSAHGLALALYRAVAAWCATRRLVAQWVRQSESVRIEGVAVPSYQLRHSFPVIAVVGVLRPRLFVAGQIFDTLSDEEIKVALAHERGHLVARDTFKRALMKACRDTLPLLRSFRALDRAWAEESERAADEHAARNGAPAVALELASALVKITRMAPAGVNRVVPAGAFLLEATGDGVAGRVRRLTEMAEAGDTRRGHESLWLKCALAAGLAAFASVMFAAFADPRVLATVHTFIERAVHLLR